MPALNRRRFLGLTGGAAAASLVGALPLSPADASGIRNPPATFATHSSQAGFGAAAARTLIVVEMEGGNDALNTLVPQAGAYHDLRPTIGLRDDELLTFDGLDYGVHPALGSLRGLWEAGQLTAVYGVGLPEQSRSHFVAQDAWRSALPGQPATSGWLGRWLEMTEPAEGVPLRAISLGASTLAAQGETGRPVAIQSVEGYRLTPPNGSQAVVDAMLAMATPVATGTFGQAQAALPETIASVEQLQGIIAAARIGSAPASTGDAVGGSDGYAPDDVSALFAAAQAIIASDVGTQVLYITLGSFDTHAGQPAQHDQLLRTVADGLSNLFAGLAGSGHADRTLAIAVSEFGRRAEENGSQGTDHGNGGLSLVMGPAVAASTVLGEADLANLADGDLRTDIDSRGIYDNALRWLGASDDLVDDVIGHDWEPLDLLAF